MIVDLTQTRAEREINSDIFLALLEAAGDQPDSLSPLIVPRRFPPTADRSTPFAVSHRQVPLMGAF